MLLRLFARNSLIDVETQQWLFACADWAIKHFDQDYFTHQSRLILPTNTFYPGRVASVEEMATAIYDNTLNYCGLTQWPFTLKAFHHKSQVELPKVRVEGKYRGIRAKVSVVDAMPSVEIGYAYAQINQPQDMIATFVQQFASVLVMSANVLPPGGKAMLPQAIDVLSCFMGFGVIFANTAYQFKGGCGSCFNPRANRQVALPENDMLYALAIYCVVKNDPKSDVISHLKKHLRSPFKKMYNEVQALQKEQKKFLPTIA
ncbi:hypothetical protein [Thalassotalea sediminis]|uniref:hypothetical protein n=1 Tax=Thalassotalea sediminis TaxID=1759089 RepID=UPI002572CFFB|nr:hypothetical protein [Thalassotalea sediminis]